ncbi:MAG: amidohydrolase, partial [Chloroflexi bacterium]|nr:amidohydrolase [Chloroflexota bacterium]
MAATSGSGGWLAVTGARILTMAGDDIPDGVLLIRDGLVVDVGSHVAIPGNATIVDARGQTITPGFIDAHTHLGIHEEAVGREGDDTNDMTDPLTPHLRALDGINPEESGLRNAASHGVSSAVVLPGSGNVIGGLG